MATINKKGKLTPAKRKQLITNLGKGMSLSGACNLVGISIERLNICLRDEESEGRLQMQIDQAQAKAEHDLCIKIMDNANARDALAFLTSRFSHWDKKGAGINTNDKTMQAEALLARMGTVPEVKRN